MFRILSTKLRLSFKILTVKKKQIILSYMILYLENF